MEFGFTREKASMDSQSSLRETAVEPRPGARCGAKLIPLIGAPASPSLAGGAARIHAYN